MTSPTSAVLVLLLMLIGQRLSQGYDVRRLEDIMHDMASDMEHQVGISAQKSLDINKEFETFGEYVRKEANAAGPGHVVNIGPGGSASIIVDYTKKRRRRTGASLKDASHTKHHSHKFNNPKT